MINTAYKNEIPRTFLMKVPARVAIHYSVFPLEFQSGVLQLMVPEDMPHESKADLRVTLGLKLAFVTAPRHQIEELITKYYGIGAGVIETLAQEKTSEAEVFDVEVIDQDQKEDITITKLVNQLFLDALQHRASDIHIEPFERSLRIRYRIDGLLQNARISEQIRMLAPNLISRVKIMAKLDIAEKRLPQDGRIKIRQQNEELDLRISVLPTTFGEAIVVRILRPLELLELETLGFDEKSIEQTRELLKKPHGVVLITGPTGSGKTTTLYSYLKELNQTERKIVTIEDPAEYKLHGILQMQVNSKIDFTFARALRSILRHDPDCIMIGEIRDSETAEIAIRSALTGHLVFSTLHTNDAPSAITRLVEMGIEPYLVASALQGVIAQRLVRKYCEACRGTSSSSKIQCEPCGGSGYYGRMAISEIMPITPEIRELVFRRTTGSEIRKKASENGMATLFENGMTKVSLGLTSAEEIQRVIAC